MVRVHGYGGTEVRISETVKKTFGIAAKRLVTGGRAIATAVATDKTAERSIRIAGGVGAPTQRISRGPGDTGVTTEETDTTPEEIYRVTGVYGVITKKISEPIAEFDGTTNDIILQG